MEAVEAALANEPLYASLIRTEKMFQESAQLKRAFADASSALSIVREEAYYSITSHLERSLSSGGSSAAAALEALEAHAEELVSAAGEALARSPSREESESEAGEDPSSRRSFAETSARRGSPLEPGTFRVPSSASRPQSSPGYRPAVPSLPPPAPSSPLACLSHAVCDAELAALLGVLQAGCLLCPRIRAAADSAGLPERLLALVRRAEGSSSPLACEGVDALLAAQLDRPDTLVGLQRRGGGAVACALLKGPGERLRAHAARYLNLVLTHLGPDLVRRCRRDEEERGREGRGEQRAAGDGGGEAGGEAAGGEAEQASGLEDGRTAAVDVEAALEQLRHEIEANLGREALAMLSRRIDFDDPQADDKLAQLASAIQFFVGG